MSILLCGGIVNAATISIACVEPFDAVWCIHCNSVIGTVNVNEIDRFVARVDKRHVAANHRTHAFSAAIESAA